MNECTLKHYYHDKFPSRYTICQSSDDNITNLGCIEIDVPPCQDVIDARHQIVSLPLHQYPNPKSETTWQLESEILDYTGTKTLGKTVILTHGSDSALSCVIDSFLQQQHSSQCPVVIITVHHTYPHVESFISKYPAGSYRLMKLTQKDTMDELSLLLENLAIVETPKIVYLPNPAMDGSYIETSSLQKLIDLFPRVLFVIDEAYFEFNRLHQEACTGKVDLSLSTAQLLNANLLTVRTFSKCFGLASIRLGYMVGYNELIEDLSKLINVKDVTEASKVLALAAIRNAPYYIEAAHHITVRNIDYIIGSLHCAFRGDAGPFIFLSFGTEDQLKDVCDRLYKEHRILIRNKHSSMPGCARATVPYNLQDCSSLIESIRDVLRYDIVLWDLDQTLRRTAQDDHFQLPDDLDPSIGRHHFVVTNNTVDSDLTMIQSDLPFIEDVWCPDMERLAVAHTRPSVRITGPPSSLVQLHELCTLYMSHSSAPDILVSDQHLKSSWQHMSELKSIKSSSISHDFELPDVLFWAKWLLIYCRNPDWKTESKIIYCGKDSVLGSIDIMNWLYEKPAIAEIAHQLRILVVGDAMTDFNLSQALLAQFRLVKLE